MILHGNSVEVLTPAVLAMCDVMITDPPYSDHVHANATSQSPGRGARHRDLGFDHLSPDLRAAVGRWSAGVKRWSAVYSDVEDSHLLRARCEDAGAQYIRTMPWVRWSMPQLSGDRPAQGFEHVLLFHAPAPGPKRWNGRGSLTHFEVADSDSDSWPRSLEGPDDEPWVPRLDHLALRGEEKHKAEKPLDQALDLVSWFSDPGEVVLDPFAGSSVIGRACALLGREYLGIELDAAWHARGNARLAAALSAGERARVTRWLAQPDDVSTAVGPALLRRQRRDADRERVRGMIQ